MRALVALLLALVVAVPALADDPEPYVRTCSTSQYGKLVPDWQERAIVAGHIAFLGGNSRMAIERFGPGMAMPLKVLVVVDANAAPRVTIAPRSRAYAALGYNGIRHNGTGVRLVDGTQSVRFQACHPDRKREPWNRGTQFGGYFLVAGAHCVHIDVATAGKVLRRKLSFGARCVRLLEAARWRRARRAALAPSQRRHRARTASGETPCPARVSRR